MLIEDNCVISGLSDMQMSDKHLVNNKSVYYFNGIVNAH